MGISSISGTWEIGANWPYPKLFFTDSLIFAVTVKASSLALYEMTNVDDVWIATEKFDLGSASEIISVDIASFDKYAVIVVNKGATKVIYERNITTGAITSTAVTIMPGGNSCCNYKGQLIIGGLYSTGAPWSTMTTCSVAWGDIGSNIMIPGDGVTKDIVAGFMKMPWDENDTGKVYKVLTLADMVMVYADNGIGYIQQTIVGKYPAMKTKTLLKSGIISTYAVNGDENIHGFVDKNYDWNTVVDGKIQNLGYRNFMKTLTGEIIVTYDASNERFYISDGLLCYVFVTDGMYTTHQCVSSIGRYKKILCGFILSNADTKIRLGTSATDFGIQDNKTVESVETGIVYDTSANEIVYGKLATRYDYKGDFITLDYTYLNERGIFTQKLTGREFKVFLQGEYEAGALFSLNSLRVKIKQSDKRNTRGRLNVN